MGSSGNASTAMEIRANRRDRGHVAGMVELRQVGPWRPHLSGARPIPTTHASLTATRPDCCLQRSAATCWRKRSCLAGSRSCGWPVRLGAALRS